MTRQHIKDLSERTIAVFQELFECSRADALREVYCLQFSSYTSQPYYEVLDYVREQIENLRRANNL